MGVKTRSDSYNSSTYEFGKFYLGVFLPVFKFINPYLPKSTMVTVHVLNGPQTPSMTWQKSFKFYPNAVNTFLTNIISDLILAESSTWLFHITNFATLNWGKVKSTLIFLISCNISHLHFLLVHWIFIFEIDNVRLIITIMELQKLSNKIPFFYLFTPLRIFIKPCRIEE